MLLPLFCFTARAQVGHDAGCTLDVPVFAATAPNIFTDRQEQDLGDAIAESIESEMRIAPPAADDQITRIGERLLATLPPTGIHYRFRIYESGEINGFSTAGGRVYISRKLVAAVKSEDELAGVLAHEIGHVSTHQAAIEFSRLLRLRLGVTQLGDRADVFAKVHQLFSTPAKRGEGEESEEKGEITADSIALDAMVRAGYAAESFPAFFNQVSLNKGNTGNWMSDLFGLTHENAKRYRSALKLIDQLPAGCKGRQAGEGDAFKAWLKITLDERVKTAAEGVMGDKPVTLDPPMRPSLWRIRFSLDGHSILAQDDTSITVLDKDSAKVLFRIDAPDVEGAQFTPDSKSIAFNDNMLRVEQWSVVTGKRTNVKEMVVLEGCQQTLLSPDAKTLVCAYSDPHGGSGRIGVRLLDVESGNTFFDKPPFAEWITMIGSPDGKYLLLSGGNKILAFDMALRQPISLDGKLKELPWERMTFMGSGSLYAAGKLKDNGMYQARVLTFPEGQLLKEGEIGGQQIEGVTKGQNLVIQPLKGYAVGIWNPMQGKVLTAAKFPVMDAWDNWIATEDGSGGVSVSQIALPDVKHVALPLEPLPGLKAVTFSDDGKYLAVSLKNRAMIWDLETGKQAKLMRPFRSAWIDDKGHLFGQFPKYMGHEPVEIRISINPNEVKELGKLEAGAHQVHDMEYHWKPSAKDSSYEHNATLEVKKMDTQAIVWTRTFKDDTPVCWYADDDRMVLAWDLRNDAVKAEIKAHPELRAQAGAMKDRKKGLLIETISAQTGAPLQQVLIPEVDISGGWDDSRRARVSGQFVLVNGEHGNTVIYGLNTGVKAGEFFGYALTADAQSGLIAATNREDEILLVDERTGKEVNRFTLGSPVRTAKFVTGKEKRLLVLTADQVVHKLPLPQ
jgi:WD40 repeat protein